MKLTSPPYPIKGCPNHKW